MIYKAMMPRSVNPLFRSFSLPVDPADRFSHRHVVEKVIPWSKSPFDTSLTKEQIDKLALEDKVEEDEDEEFVPDEVPQWLELFFDLAWTTTFSGLTGGTPIKDPGAIASYSTFFMLTWWLWVSQVSYDTKFYTNDMFHRIMLVFQFVAFGALASFTAGFDIFNGLSHDAATDPIDQQVDDAYVSRAFKAICLVFGITRFLLAIQYIRVSRLAKRCKAGNVYLTIGSLVISGLLFFIVYIALTQCTTGTSAHTAHIVKFVLWGLALAVEISVFVYAASPYGLIRRGSMSERLATLTTVVLGEGLNGLIDPLVSVAKSVGFNGASAGQILTMAFLVLMVFVLYFASFDTRGAITSTRQKLIIFIHFPTHLILILMLEGMKSVMGFMTMSQSLASYIIAMSKAQDLSDVQSEFAKIGVDYVDIAAQLVSIPLSPEEQANEDVHDLALGFRIIAEGGRAILDQFNALTDELEDDIHSYVFDTTPTDFASDDAVAVFNSPDPDDAVPPRVAELLGTVTADQLNPVSWIAAAAGVFLLCLLFLTLVRRGPFNRYHVWSIISRLVIASTLIFLTFLDLDSDRLVSFIITGAFLPTILVIYLVQYIVDYVIHMFVAREIRQHWQVPVPPPKDVVMHIQDLRPQTDRDQDILVRTV